jgi:hypothetical protein
MRKLLTLITGMLLMGSFHAEAAEIETAKEAVKNMGVGWNLGNTLDANDATKTWKSTEEHEICWGQPVTKPELIKMMKEAGFGAIRVPVTWYQEIDSEGKINEAWMNRVKEVVDYVINEGLYCIINVHHDTGADKGSFKSWIKADETNYTQNRAKFESIWKQIAQTFKDYDQHLLFEGYNEMLDANSCWCYPTFYEDQKNYDANYAKKSLETINNYAKSFVTAVRYAGGNNMKRNLIINTYAASPGGNWGHANDVVEQFKLPTGESDHIIVEVHNYPNISSGFNSAKSNIDWIFSNINDKIIKKLNVPVIIGEWSSSNVDSGAGKTDYDARKEDFLKFADYWVKKAKTLNIATFYWMGLSDGAYRSIPVFNQADLAETIVKAYHGNNFEGKFPSPSTETIEYVVTYVSDWSELFLYGDWNDNGIKVNAYKGIRVEMDKAYGDKLQVKIYGDKSGSEYKTQEVKLSANSATTTVDFDASKLGTNVYRITLQTMVGAQEARVRSAKLIKADGSEVDGSITVAWGCEVKSEAVPSGIRSVETVRTDGAIYDLQGRRIQQTPQRGLYIQNGKKYMVK